MTPSFSQVVWVPLDRVVLGRAYAADMNIAAHGYMSSSQTLDQRSGSVPHTHIALELQIHSFLHKKLLIVRAIIFHVARQMLGSCRDVGITQTCTTTFGSRTGRRLACSCRDGNEAPNCCVTFVLVPWNLNVQSIRKHMTCNRKTSWHSR